MNIIKRIQEGKFDLYLHEDQKKGFINGNILYIFFKDNEMLKDMATLSDLEEIQKKGIAFFRKHFKGKAVFGWASIVRDRDGRLKVPCLFESGGKVVFNWLWSALVWLDSSPALRFASTKKSDTQSSMSSELRTFLPDTTEARLLKIENWIKKEANFINPFD